MRHLRADDVGKLCGKLELFGREELNEIEVLVINAIESPLDADERYIARHGAKTHACTKGDELASPAIHADRGVVTDGL